MSTRLSTNVVAGAVSSFVTLLVAVVATPLYLHLIGAEAFGVLGFVFSLQAALLALDGGIALSATRTVAQSQAQPDRRPTADLVFGLARVSWMVAFAIVILMAAIAFSLAVHWLNLVELEPLYVTQSLMVAGVAIGIRWPLALYQGILIGSHRQVSLSAINVLTTLLSTGGSIALLAWFAPDLRALFGWLAATGLLQVFWTRRIARQVLGSGQPPARGEVPQYFRRSAAAGWLGLVGLLLMQVDKVVLSKVLPLRMFGYYVMAAMMAAGLYAVVTPVFNVLYPQFTVMAAAGDSVGLRRLYRSSSVALTTLLFPMAAVMAFFSESILLLWTADPVAADAGAPIVSLLALATAVHGIMFVPYALKLACGASRLALVIGVTVLIFSFPAIVFGALHWGGPGAAGAWLAVNLVYILLGSLATHRRLLPGLGHRWLLLDVAPPAIFSLCAAFALAWSTQGEQWSAAQRTALGAVLVVACWFLMACTSSRLRLAVRSVFANKLGSE